MSELQKYWHERLSKEIGKDVFVYLDTEADARIAQLEAQVAAMRERDIRLTERRAALLLENQQLQMEVDLHKRALDWLTYNSPVRCFDGKFRRGVCTDTVIEVPAELAEIIRGRQV